MFEENDGTILAELVEEFNLNESDRAVVEAFLKLTDEQRATIIKAIRNVADEIKKNGSPPKTEITSPAPSNEEEKEITVKVTQEELDNLMRDRAAREYEKVECTSADMAS